VPLDTSFAHQLSCNIFFSKRFFFWGEGWEKYVVAPPTPQTGPHYPGLMRTICPDLRAIWGGRPSVPKEIQGCRAQAKSREAYDYFYFDLNGPTVLGQIFGPTVGDFFVLSEKMGQNLENFREIPKMSGKKKSNFRQTHAVRYVIGTSIQLQHCCF
jgi:hypothetical protein